MSAVAIAPAAALAEPPAPDAAAPDCRQMFFLGLPRRPGFRPEGEGPGQVKAVRPVARGRLGMARSSSSLLCLTFNKLWCLALNRAGEGWTHFGMQHDDIRPPAGWGDVLIDEMDAHGAAVCSAVVPIKDDRGLTTTAVRNGETGHTRRLTMAEVFRLPETFGLAEVHALGIHADGPPEGELLAVNTGLWVTRLDAAWVQPWPGWHIGDGIMTDPQTGLRRAGCVPEDWAWSEWLHRRGQRVVATRKVALAHLDTEGREYRNDAVWGRWTEDLGDDP
jgi:hypothetical protein